MYARSISLVSVLILVAAFIIGAYDGMRLVYPAFTLNPAQHEKYGSNEAYTEHGSFRKELSDDEITRERVEGYEKLLRIERKSAIQQLAKVAFALAAIALLNAALIVAGRRRQKRESGD